MDAKELAMALKEKAKIASIFQQDAPVDYTFALNYLAEDLQGILQHLTPAKRRNIAKRHGLL